MTGLLRARSRARFTFMAAATAVVVLALTAVGGAAHADSPVKIVFKATDGSNIQYGGEWGYQVNLKNTRCASLDCEGALTLKLSGDNGKTFTATTDVYASETAYIGRYDFDDALPAGKYSITASFADPKGWVSVGNPGMAASNKPATLTIAAAPVAIDFRIESDPHQNTGAVVNAHLTGTYLDQLAACYGSEQCHEPLGDGRWDFVITDDTGATVVEKRVSARGTDGQFASFYWHSVPAGSNFTATAQFTFTDADRKNYAVEPASGLSFTSPEAVPAGEPGSPEIAPVAAEPQSSPSLPLWAVLSWLLVIVLLAAVITTFALLVRRQRRAATSIDPDNSETTGELVKGVNS